MHELMFLHLTFRDIGHDLDIFIGWNNVVLQMLETRFSKENYLLVSHTITD